VFLPAVGHSFYSDPGLFLLDKGGLHSILSVGIVLCGILILFQVLFF
jgi:hypothetical protein